MKTADYPTLTISSNHTPGGYQGFTTIFVTGPNADAIAYCDNYLEEWPTAGYSTTARLHETLDADTCTMRIWHSNYCG